MGGACGGAVDAVSLDADGELERSDVVGAFTPRELTGERRSDCGRRCGGGPTIGGSVVVVVVVVVDVVVVVVVDVVVVELVVVAGASVVVVVVGSSVTVSFIGRGSSAAQLVASAANTIAKIVDRVVGLVLIEHLPRLGSRRILRLR